MLWCRKCCGVPGGEGEHGDPGHDSEQIGAPVRNMIYNRIGRVEKSRHGGTVLFLGIAVFSALLMILLVQFIADQVVCSSDVPFKDLPGGVQRILTTENCLDSWRCPYDEKFDVSFTFGLVIPENSTANLTMFKVHMADITPSKPIERSSTSRLSESVSHLCGKQCSVNSCECVKSMIFSPRCYLEKYKYGLQVKPSNP